MLGAVPSSRVASVLDVVVSLEKALGTSASMNSCQVVSKEQREERAAEMAADGQKPAAEESNETAV